MTPFQLPKQTPTKQSIDQSIDVIGPINYCGQGTRLTNLYLAPYVQTAFNIKADPKGQRRWAPAKYTGIAGLGVTMQDFSMYGTLKQTAISILDLSDNILLNRITIEDFDVGLLIGQSSPGSTIAGMGRECWFNNLYLSRCNTGIQIIQENIPCDANRGSNNLYFHQVDIQMCNGIAIDIDNHLPPGPLGASIRKIAFSDSLIHGFPDNPNPIQPVVRIKGNVDFVQFTNCHFVGPGKDPTKAVVVADGCGPVYMQGSYSGIGIPFKRISGDGSLDQINVMFHKRKDDN